jgi:rfaE bifunctional protein nucleotidyltransferase chain/domain
MRDGDENVEPLVSAESVMPLSVPQLFDALMVRVHDWKRAGERIVLCHGCFDPLHVGHVHHFKAARRFGERVVVTVTPDAHVNKGANRPLFRQDERFEVVSSLRCVDAAAINLWSSAVETIRLLQPHVLAKGAEYRDRSSCNLNIIAEEEAIRNIGGKLCYTEELTHSSTALIERLKAQNERVEP